MLTRREALARSAALTALLMGAGFLPEAARAEFNAPAFSAKTMADTFKAIGATSAPKESADVSITAPDIAENGAVVPVTLSTTLPNVKYLAVMVEKNPNMLSALFEINEFIEPNFAVRVKMGQSSDIYAVALTNDGKAFFAKKEVKVTLGGCGG